MELEPEFNPPLVGDGFGTDGKLLARELDTLEQLARSAGVPTLSAFMDNRPAPELDPDDLALELTIEEWQKEWDEWFPADDGLRSVEGMLAVLKTNPPSDLSPKVRRELIEILELAAKCLRLAVDQGVRFRLQFTM